MDAPPDTSLLQWAIGGLGALCAAISGHMHLRITRVEDSTRASIAEVERKRSEENAEKWRAINANRRDFDLFALTVVTKEDLRDFERRVMAALTGKQG